MDDTRYLDEAIELARASLDDDRGGPFGAVVVRDGRVLGRGRNRVLGDGDPTAHAEVVAIRDAARRQRTHDLAGATLYSSCEPCPMCLGALYWAGIQRVVYAADRHGAARTGFSDADLYEELCKPPSARRLTSVRIPRPEAEAVMAAWQQGGGRHY